MGLTGSNKRAYQREYMKKRRSNKGLTGSNSAAAQKRGQARARVVADKILPTTAVLPVKCYRIFGYD